MKFQSVIHTQGRNYVSLFKVNFAFLMREYLQFQLYNDYKKLTCYSSKSWIFINPFDYFFLFIRSLFWSLNLSAYILKCETCSNVNISKIFLNQFHQFWYDVFIHIDISSCPVSFSKYNISRSYTLIAYKL